MNLNKQKGFSFIEISLGLSFLMMITIGTILLASPRKAQAKTEKVEQYSVKEDNSKNVTQTVQAVEKESPILKHSFKSIH